MTGNSVWLWIIPVLFALGLAALLALALSGDMFRRRHGNDLPPKTSKPGEVRQRGPVMGGTIAGSPGQRNSRDWDPRTEIDPRQDEPGV